MTDRELKKYAIVGMLIRLQEEQYKLKIQTNERHRQQTQKRIDTIVEHYNETLKELKENPLE